MSGGGEGSRGSPGHGEGKPPCLGWVVVGRPTQRQGSGSTVSFGPRVLSPLPPPPPPHPPPLPAQRLHCPGPWPSCLYSLNFICLQMSSGLKGGRNKSAWVCSSLPVLGLPSQTAPKSPGHLHPRCHPPGHHHRRLGHRNHGSTVSPLPVVLKPLTSQRAFSGGKSAPPKRPQCCPYWPRGAVSLSLGTP